MGNKRQKVIFNKNHYEFAAWAEQKVVCGIDEVGRGCLAGPLVTAAVILPPGKLSQEHLKDSKIMTELERLKAARWIEKRCWYGLGIVNHRIIDQYNIWQATLLAMKRALLHAISSCPLELNAILIDAMPLKLFDTSYGSLPVYHFPKGERKSSSIAAASIIAKVKRDELMTKFERIFPGYHLGEHKGYGTQKHTTAIREISYSIIHRQSFLGKTLPPEEDEYEEQQSLC